MAYALYMYKSFPSRSGKTIRLEIFERDYTGEAMEIEAMGSSPIILETDNANGQVDIPILKTSVSITIKDTGQIDYSRFFTPDATKFKVLIKIEGVDEWSGYLTPDSYSQSLSYRSDVNLIARDNLGMLSEFTYTNTDTLATIQSIINSGMTLINFTSTLEYRVKKIDGENANILTGLIPLIGLRGKKYSEVIDSILQGIGCQMRFVGANTYAIYDIGDLSSYGDDETPQDFLFINKSGMKELLPAWREMEINQEYGTNESIYDGVLDADDYVFTRVFNMFNAYRILTPYQYTPVSFYTPLGNNWSGNLEIANPRDFLDESTSSLLLTGAAYLKADTTYKNSVVYTRSIPPYNGGLKIRFAVRNALQFPDYPSYNTTGQKKLIDLSTIPPYIPDYGIKFRYNVFLVTSTATYILKEKWVEYVASELYYNTFQLEKPEYESGDGYYFNPQNISLEVNIGTLSTGGELKIAFYPYDLWGASTSESHMGEYLCKVSNIDIDIVSEFPSGRSTKVVINENHNILGNISLNIGEVPSGLLNTLSLTGGIFKNATYYPPMTGFKKPTFPTYHLSELVGREVAHHYKTQKSKLSGQVIKSTNYGLLGFGKPFTDGTNTYILNYGSLDLASEIMQVELIEAEAYETEDFTFVDAEVSTGGGSSLGSGSTEFIQWSAAGNAKRLYELTEASEAEKEGSYVIIDKAGFTEAKKFPYSGIKIHSNLTNLAWTLSGHTGTASKIAGFGVGGIATEFSISESKGTSSTTFLTQKGIADNYHPLENQRLSTTDDVTFDKVTMTENNNTNLRIPKTAPTGMEELQWYFSMTETGFAGEEPSGGGGVTSLWALTELTKTGTETTNQVLTFNGTKWTNQLLTSGMVTTALGYTPQQQLNNLTAGYLPYADGNKKLVNSILRIVNNTLLLEERPLYGGYYFGVNQRSSGTQPFWLQAGALSNGFGGSIGMYGHSHPTYGGWVVAGISANSGGAFAVQNQALGGGTNLFLVKANGNVDIGYGGTRSEKLAVAGSGWFNGDLSMLRLSIPVGTPTGMTPGRWYFSMTETGFAGEEPSGGGGVTSLWGLTEVSKTAPLATPVVDAALLIFDSTAGKFRDKLLTSGMVTTALGYTPYNATNPSGYISGITKPMVEGVLKGNINTHTHDSRYQPIYFGGKTIDANVINSTSCIAEYRWLNTPANSIGLLYTNVQYAPNWFTQDIHYIAENKRFFRNYNGSNGSFSPWFQFYHSGNLNKSDVAFTASQITLNNLTAGYIPFADSGKKLVNSPIWTDGTKVDIGYGGSRSEKLAVAGSGWFNGDLSMLRLSIPVGTPTGMTPGRWYFSMTETGFAGEEPSGGGGVTSLWGLTEVSKTAPLATPVVDAALLIFDSTAGKFRDKLLTSGMVTTALGYTPYNATNPSGYISGITKPMVEGVLKGNINTHTHDSRYQPIYFGGKTIDANVINSTSCIAEYRWLNTPANSIGLLYTNVQYAPNWFTQDIHYIAENKRFFRNYNGSNGSFSPWFQFYHSGNLNKSDVAFTASQITLNNLTAGYIPFADSGKKLVNSPIWTDGTKVDIGYGGSRSEKLAVAGSGWFDGDLSMLRLSIPVGNVTGMTSGRWYFSIIE